MAEVVSSTSKSEDECSSFRNFPPPPNDKLPSPPTSKSDEDTIPFRYFPPPPTDRLPSPPAMTVSDTDGSGSIWEKRFHRKNATISGVTNDARKVLDSFLNRSFGHGVRPSGRQHDPVAIGLKASKQDEILIDKLQKKLMQLNRLAESEPEELLHHQHHDQQEESHYVYPHALRQKITCPYNTPQPSKPETAIPKDRNIESAEIVDSCEPTPLSKKKHFQIPLHDSASSSSTEDYELVDPNEFLARKKKSFFRRATERLMQSFRRRHERHLDGELESPKEEAVPGEHIPGLKGKQKGKGQPFLSDIDEKKLCDSAFMGKSPAKKLRTGHPNLAKTGSSSGDNNGCGVVQSEGEGIMKARKSPLPWKHRWKVKDEHDNESKGRLFDHLIRGIRKGSFKLKKKGTKDHQRSHSADNLTIRPLSKDHEKVLLRYTGQRISALALESDGTESDNATVRSIHEVIAHRVDHGPARPTLSGLVDELPPLPPVKVSTPAGGKDSDDYDEIDEMVAGTGVERVCHSETGEDDIDGMLQDIFKRQASLPFHERTEAQKEELYEKIAEQLAVIADYYNVKLGSELGSLQNSPKKVAEEQVSKDEVKPSVKEDSSNSDKELAAAAKIMHRKKRKWRKQLSLQRPDATDEVLGSLLHHETTVSDPTPIVEELVRNASYSKFQQIVSQNIGDEPGWDQLARMFKLTQTAVGLAGMGTAVSLQIKEMTIKYFEDKFAGWIVNQGGWESVVEDTNTENDSELD